MQVFVHLADFVRQTAPGGHVREVRPRTWKDWLPEEGRETSRVLSHEVEVKLGVQGLGQGCQKLGTTREHLRDATDVGFKDRQVPA